MTFPLKAFSLSGILPFLFYLSFAQTGPNAEKIRMESDQVQPGAALFQSYGDLYTYKLTREEIMQLRKDQKKIGKLILKPQFQTPSQGSPFDMAVFAAVKQTEYASETEPIILHVQDKTTTTLNQPTIIGNLHLSMSGLKQVLKENGLTGNLAKDTAFKHILLVPDIQQYGKEFYLEYKVQLVIVDKQPLLTTLKAKPSPPAQPGS